MDNTGPLLVLGGGGDGVLYEECQVKIVGLRFGAPGKSGTNWGWVSLSLKQGWIFDIIPRYFDGEKFPFFEGFGKSLPMRVVVNSPLKDYILTGKPFPEEKPFPIGKLSQLWNISQLGNLSKVVTISQSGIFSQIVKISQLGNLSQSGKHSEFWENHS